MLEQRSRKVRDPDDGDGRTRSGAEVEQLADEARRTGRYTAPLMFAAGVIIAVAVAVLIVQNRERTTVEWLVWDPTGPMWTVLVATFVAGLVTGPLLVGAWSLVRHHRQARDRHIDDLARRSG